MKMLDRETRKRIEDFFEPSELVEYLGISIEDIVDIFEEEIDEQIEDIEELIQVTHPGQDVSIDA